MSEADKYMDDSFKRMREEFKVSYDKSFWEEAKAGLEDDSLDSAFREAAANFSAVSVGGMEFASESLSDAFMDEAFRDAAKEMSVTYDAAYWSQLEADRANLEMDEAFLSASKDVKASYHPKFWGDADIALQREGLHYEYNSAYWDEAKELLDRADRTSFFKRWTGVAALLLLISFLGLNGNLISDYSNTLRENESEGHPSTKNQGLAHDTDLPDELAVNENEQRTNENEISETFTVERNEGSTLSNDFIVNDANENERESLSDGLDEALANEVETNENGLDHNSAVPEDREERDEDEVEDNGGVDVVDAIAVVTEMESVENYVTPEMHVLSEEKLDMNPLFLSDIENTMRPVQWEGREHDISTYPLMEVGQLRPKPIHTIAIFGGIGRGNSYGYEEFTASPRYTGGLTYLLDGLDRKSRFALGTSVSLNYSTHYNLRHIKKETTFLNNGGVAYTWRDVIYSDLFYVNFGLNMNYKFLKQHNIKLGVGLSSLAAVQTNMFNKINEETGLQIENNNWGVQEGVRRLDMTLTLGYEFKINKEFGVFINGNYGLFDRSDDDFFSKYPTHDNEMNVMVGVRYNLFRGIR